MSADPEDLEALFDQVAAQSGHRSVAAAAPAAAPAPVLAVVPPAAPAPAEEDLEALFDQVAAQSQASRAVPAAAPTEELSGPVPDEVFQRIGSLTRSLHDALRELGYDKAVEEAVSALPDTRDRLTYIAELTGKAAERVLAAVEQGQGFQNDLDAHAKKLAAQWERVFSAQMPVEEFKTTAEQTREFLRQLPEHTSQTNAQLTEIMMAQDFHDLTGQVIQRVVKVAQNMEAQLLKLLLEASPPEKRHGAEAEWLTGPAVNAAGRDDVVTSQAQVDDLLESLGF